MAIYNQNSAQLIVVEPNRTISSYDLAQDSQFIIGRAGGPNDIQLQSPAVTSQHGMFSSEKGVYTYIDLGSTNGTYINGHKIKNQPRIPSSEIVLKNCDVLTIAPQDQNQVSIIFFTNMRDCAWNIVSLAMHNVATIGRNENNDIVIPNVAVSRHHAEIKNVNNQFVIRDLGSMNGTIVNGSVLKGTRQLKDGDIIRISSTVIVFTNGCLVYSIQNAAQIFKNAPQTSKAAPGKVQHAAKGPSLARKGGIEVKVEHVSRIVSCKKNTGINNSGKKKILDDISLTIQKGEFVAILGGSGAGKTTFMNCINGFEPATEGTVLIDGVELYKNYQSLKSRMGYVPQQDIVHDNLTLRDMLRYTGKLRLPHEDIKTTLDKRVDEVIEMVDLTEQRDTLIKKLSGGQRKRASIAVELLSDPQLMFLDEPTSGLDPEAETSLMTQLRRLSDEGGKTVIVVTHTLQNIGLFDKVIFLAPGGKLCFFGTPNDACKFFEVDNLTNAYRKILGDVDGYVKRFNRTRQGV
ncbi:MAG: FHA domain-containing protein [Acutalibacteraceae bacterium]